jgi:uncharacterized repeat protein (TIGR02543 family)
MGKNSFWSGLSLVVFVVCVLAVSVTANPGDFTYTDNGDNITITGYTGPGGAVEIPPEIDGKPVTSISSEAFSKLTGPTSVTIPDSVTNIGYAAFKECTDLASVTIGNGVTSIGSSAFENCTELTSATIGSSVTSIGSSAFKDCTKLDSVTIPNSITSIGGSAFENCTGLTSATIGNSVVYIGNFVFFGCTKLASITIPDSATSIGNYAFYDCAGLTSLTIGSGIASIGYCAFYGCAGLTSVTIPNSVTSIGNSSFVDCTGLTSVTIGSGLASIESYLFSGCTRLTSVTIPDSAASIGSYAFFRCTGLTSVTIGGGVTSIGEAAFYGCAGLTSVTFPNSVTSIVGYAFYDCTGLTSVTIGSGVTSIGDFAFFSNNSNLIDVVFFGNAPSIGSEIFHSHVSNFKVYYIEGADGFTSPTWKGYPSAILSYPVTFDLAGKGARTGGGELSQTVNHGAAATAPTVTANPGWTLNGWDKTFSNITAVTAITAQYSPATYTVTYDAEGGSVSPSTINVSFSEVYGPLATPARSGCTFAGWWTGDNGTGAQVIETTIVSNTANHTLYAKWILPMVGVALEFPPPPEFEGLNITVKGMPAGLKYNATAKRIRGVPTKAGTFNILFSAGGQSQTRTVPVEVLPPWAQGAFNGLCVVNGDSGIATMTVSVLGKVTGKLSAAGKNYPFDALSYVRRDEDGAFWISTGILVDKVDVPLTLKLTNAPGIAPPTLSVAQGWFSDETEGEPVVKMYRNVWKDEGMADVLKNYADYYTAVLPGGSKYGSGYLTITVDKDGGVKTAGKLADGTALSLSGTLIIDGNEPACVFTVIYASPTTYKGGCLFGVAEFVKLPDRDHMFLQPLNGISFIWESRNPQATEVYGDGWVDRKLGLVGGWYDKSENIYNYYEGKTMTSGANADAPVPELTVGVNHYPSVWWNFSDIALAPEVPKAGVPVDPDRDNVWDYSAVNTVGLKAGLTRVTGVFKGSFKAWFDYDKTHTSRNISCEGVLTPERENKTVLVEGRGFFLWPDKALKPNPKGKPIPYSFNWSYDFLVQGDK